MTMAVTTQILAQGDVDEAKYAAFVAKVTRQHERAMKRGARGYEGWSPADCAEAARSYCVMYREQYRTLVPVASMDEANRVSRVGRD